MKHEMEVILQHFRDDVIPKVAMKTFSHRQWDHNFKLPVGYLENFKI